MKTRRREGTERDRILESFIEVVGEQGYAATSLEEILSVADVDEETFRRHFQDEDACFRAAWELASDGYMRAVLAAHQSQTTWREQIRAVGVATVEYLMDHPPHGRFLFVEGPTPGNPLRAPLDDPNIEVFIELVDAGRQQMPNPSALTRATAEGLVGAVNQRVARLVERGAIEELPQLLPQLMSLIVRPYLGDEASLEELSRETLGER